MLAVIVNFEAEPGQGEALLEALKFQSANSLEKEPGCRRFDVCSDPEDAHHFLLYELYDDEAAFSAHTQTEHYAAFQERIKPVLKARERQLMTRL